jgi:hypothetical protein
MANHKAAASTPEKANIFKTATHQNKKIEPTKP